MKSPSVVDQALAALHLADVAAGRAAPVAAAAVRRAVRERDDRAVSIAERAWGRALRQTGDVDDAIRHLRRAVAAAERVGAADLVGEARIPLSAALVQRGRSRQAVREIDAAVAGLTDCGRARALAQRADVLHQIGRSEAARAGYAEAIPLLRAHGDQLNLQRTLVNRGILHTELHSFAAAEADLREADRLARMLGRELAAGIIAENLGFLETMRGDVPAALAHLDRAEAAIGAHGGQLGPVFSDRAELLLSVGAPAEAKAAAARAVAAFEQQRRGLLVPGARLLLAQTAFRTQDWDTALTQARLAHRQFVHQLRGEWAALARLVVVRTELARSARSRTSTASLLAMVATLSAAKWPAAAVEARLAAAEVLITRRDTAAAKRLFTEAAATRTRGPAALRARGWHAHALARDLDGDRRGMSAAIRSGLRVLDEHSTSLGAADLRAYSAAHRGALSELGLRAALRDGGPRAIFEWAERGRASRLRHQSLLPPDDPVLAGLLAQLRASARAGGHGLTDLERRIRDHTRLHRGSANPTVLPVPLPRLAAALGDRALVEYFQLDGVMHALTVVDGRARHHDLGPIEPIDDLVRRLPFALHRLARHGGAERSHVAAANLLSDAAARLDALVLGPITELGNRPLVAVPTGALHNLPWSVLPTCAGRPVTVSPSATLWADAPAPVGGTAAAIAGPGLTGARGEAVAVAAIHATKALVDDHATVEATLAVLGACDIVHLAAHGRLTTDNPLFSSLGLHDGPLVAYDLDRQARVPHTVVLASCDGGRSMVCTGDELLGLSAAFIGRGTARLVASVVPIPDGETAELMTEFHRLLVAGSSAPTALALAQQRVRAGGRRAMAAAAGFVCVGG
ncbi:MAG TPA: CHAT domain-containing protein [Actinokineospora sp.]|nr:CHAT domain-containing protein [Actinokineospora sp.]